MPADPAVETGSVFGLLGPNGAGKTTAVRIDPLLLVGDGLRPIVHRFVGARRVAEFRA